MKRKFNSNYAFRYVVFIDGGRHGRVLTWAFVTGCFEFALAVHSYFNVSAVLLAQAVPHQKFGGNPWEGIIIRQTRKEVLLQPATSVCSPRPARAHTLFLVALAPLEPPYYSLINSCPCLHGISALRLGYRFSGAGPRYNS